MTKKSRRAFVREGTSADNICQELQERIVTGALIGGSPLRQRELAEQFGVSTIPVREALRQLESNGLVKFRPRRGAVVVKLTADGILDLLDVRVALECRALELAVPNMVSMDFDKANKILTDYSKERSPARWSNLNREFHRCLYEPCGRYHLLEFVDDIQNRIGPYLRLNVSIITGLERPDSEHHQILNACKEGDGGAAVQLLREHITATQKEVTGLFRHNLMTIT